MYFVIPLLAAHRISTFLDDNEGFLKTSQHAYIKENYKTVKTSSCYKRW